ncbi:Mg chelatase-like protein [Aedoeadaptatus coxii]|uniref:YifB family Mg chelatase-like AAA ATPase n=1 Tax=Aedoeadaptatus coxii TaxID=755172 RepID=UPI00176BB626|nr:YifB family Mg chelatase-like AAA ATPase [Peptoniphilus coxii]CAC9930611.1 Mg chelatase-like protein [Peptoniphilus coxii]
MYARVKTCSLEGLEGFVVEVECDLGRGLPRFLMVGLPDAQIRESGERVHSAIKNIGMPYPQQKITVNLAPANRRKDGSQMDLAIAISVLSAQGLCDPELVEQYIFLGELQLNGEVSGIRGALPMVASLRELGYKEFIVPKENEKETAVIEDVSIYPASNLREVVDQLNGEGSITPAQAPEPDEEDRLYTLDFSDIKGQSGLKRAMEVAAAGGHNLLMIGPPGSGKSMSAKRLPTILPRMAFDEAVEVTKIYSVSGELTSSGLMTERPFRAPHHTASGVSLIGGGRIPKPGEISLAHRGVLFLDELPEFQSKVLEVLRQPMEDGAIHISRAQARLKFPADFQLVASMNPCPCGYYQDPHHECSCSMQQIKKYLGKISHPLLDRIDLQVEVKPVNYDDMKTMEKGETSEVVWERVEKARALQRERFNGTAIRTNADIPENLIEQYCKLKESSQKLLDMAYKKYKFSGRSIHKILKVARTVADLRGGDDISDEDVLEAIRYKTVEGKYWSE